MVTRQNQQQWFNELKFQNQTATAAVAAAKINFKFCLVLVVNKFEHCKKTMFYHIKFNVHNEWIRLEWIGKWMDGWIKQAIKIIIFFVEMENK